MKLNKDIIKDISENFIKENRKDIIEEFQASFDLIYSELELDTVAQKKFIKTSEGISFSDINITDLSLIGIVYHVFSFVKQALCGNHIEYLQTKMEEYINNLERRFIKIGYNRNLIHFIARYLKTLLKHH